VKLDKILHLLTLDKRSVAISKARASHWAELSEELGLSLSEQDPSELYSSVCNHDKLLAYLHIKQPELSPYKWDDRPDQMSECISYLWHLFASFQRDLMIHDVSKKDALTSSVASFHIKGTTDLLVGKRPCSLIPVCNTVAIFELKKKQKSLHMYQILLQVISVNRLSNHPCIGILSNLADSWTFYWKSHLVLL
jgi:hypothetical protein